jgi:hypothetical protein
MNRKINFIVVFQLVLILVTACGGVPEQDQAVCQAYQDLIDAWPADSAEVQAAESAEAIFDSITVAGEALIVASQAANDPDIRDAGQFVGEAAASFAERNDSLVARGFVPFFSESLVGGEELTSLCEQIEVPVSLP